MIKNDRLRLLSALGHVVEVLDDLKPCGHSGDEETGEHDADCMLCRWEAAMAHADEEGGVKGGIEPSSPLPLADVPPSPHGSVFGTDAVCMPPVSAGGMTCPDCDGRGHGLVYTENKCGFCGGTGHVLRDHK
jgi:hypothetical protein